MKKKEVDLLRQKDPEALQQDVKRMERELFDLRQQAVTQKIEDTSKASRVRRDIARVKTILNQKQPQTTSRRAKAKARAARREAALAAAATGTTTTATAPTSA